MSLLLLQLLFFFLSSGRWGKTKIKLTTLPRIFMHVVCTSSTGPCIAEFGTSYYCYSLRPQSSTLSRMKNPQGHRLDWTCRCGCVVDMMSTGRQERRTFQRSTTHTLKQNSVLFQTPHVPYAHSRQSHLHTYIGPRVRNNTRYWCRF